MEVKVIIFSALLFFSKCASVDPRDITNQKHQNHQVHYARPPVENKWSLPQYNFPDSINNKHVYKQNNSPIDSPFKIVQNHRQLPVKEVIQLNPNIKIQQKNLMSNNFLMNGSNLQIKRNPQLPIVKQGISAMQVLAIQNQHYGKNSPSKLEHDILNRRLINTKIVKEHRAVPRITDVTNVRQRYPINQEYKRNSVPAQNTNNGLLLGNTNKNINTKKVLPIQQPVANKRYTLIRKNGVVEHYEDLGVILKKYPQIKLPLNLRQVADSTGINNSLKSSENARTSHLTKPFNNMNIPLNQNNNNIAATSVIDRPTNFQNQISQNTKQISDSIQDNRYRNTGNPIAKIPVSNSVMLPTRNHGGTLMHLTNQVLNAEPDLKNINEEQTQNNLRSENLSNHVNKVSEKSVTNLQTENVTSPEKSAITAKETVVNKFENTKEKNTTLCLKRSSDLESQSYNKFDKNIATIEKNNKLLKQQSAPAIILNITKSSTAGNNLEQKEIHKIITDQENSNEDSWLPNTPVMWFTTNDPNFFDKLVDENANNHVYIINIQSHPKTEKDTKTVVHANGTIVEEIIESIWEYDDDEPKITKTVKITPASDSTKENIVAEH